MLSQEQKTSLRAGQLAIRAINHKLRHVIMSTILAEKNRITVTDIYVRLRLEQSVASHHLAILRKAGAMTTKRDGKFIYYSVNKTRVNEIIAAAKSLQ